MQTFRCFGKVEFLSDCFEIFKAFKIHSLFPFPPLLIRLLLYLIDIISAILFVFPIFKNYDTIQPERSKTT